MGNTILSSGFRLGNAIRIGSAIRGHTVRQTFCGLSLGVGWLLATPASAQDLTFNDGTPSRVQHTCVVAAEKLNQQEDLIWTSVGFQGLPMPGNTYYVRVVISSVGCSGAWVRPEIKLPIATSFTGASNAIRCFTGAIGDPTLVAVNDGSCPTAPAPGLYPDDDASFPNPPGSAISNDYLGLPPANGLYWALPPGQVLYIEVPVTSTQALAGVSGSDVLLGAVNVVDNNPGGAAVPWDGPGASYNGEGEPPHGPWQGAFVFQPTDTNPRIGYAEPAAQAITATTATLCAHVFNGDPNSNACIQWPASTTTVPFSTSLSFPGLVTNAGTENMVSSNLSPGNSGLDVCMDYAGLKPSQLYQWSVDFRSDAILASCVGIENPELDPSVHFFQTPPSVPPPSRLVLMNLADGNGTLTLAPAGALYASGQSVTVTAVPAAGTTLSAWVVDGEQVEATKQNSPYVLTMSTNHTIVGVFVSTGTVVGTPPKKGLVRKGCSQSSPEGMVLAWLAPVLVQRYRRRR